MAVNEVTFLILVVVISLEIGALTAYLIENRKFNRLREKYQRVIIELDYERKAAAAREATFEETTRTLKDTFSRLAGNALRDNTEQFLQLARENMKQFQIHAESELGRKEKAIENLVKPIQDALGKTEVEMHRMENARHEAQGALTRHLESIAESHRLLQGETRNLVQALRRPEVRGQWGELTLRRLVELAGMVEHCDFTEQATVAGESGRQRPDMVIRMPDRRDIVVDAKTPLDAYLSAVEANEDDLRGKHLERHARNVRTRIKELSAKAYWKQFRHSPEFVVLFIPGDQFLSAALESNPALLEDALAQHVILATPSSFVALLRAVAYGWRQETLARNAEEIQAVGQEMYARLTTFAEHLARLGRSLDSSVDAFNRAAGSYDARVLPGARKFSELGVTGSDAPPAVEQIERATRRVEARCDSSESGIVTQRGKARS
ncbi:MAG TPA: DNA recombination protein RmuC [Gammaproteobacteria bacterium]|nr:DNA recombination protein RmuC [Gammaproteobacteria bacterium]